MATGFDHIVHKRNKKGKIASKQPYTLHIMSGVRKYERPPGSGKFFTENNEPIIEAKRATKEEEKK